MEDQDQDEVDDMNRLVSEMWADDWDNEEDSVDPNATGPAFIAATQPWHDDLAKRTAIATDAIAEVWAAPLMDATPADFT